MNFSLRLTDFKTKNKFLKKFPPFLHSEIRKKMFIFFINGDVRFESKMFLSGFGGYFDLISGSRKPECYGSGS